VNYDIANYKKYFATGNGGAWDDEHEIYAPEVNTFSWQELDAYMVQCENHEHVDLWVIVFAGHGWADKVTKDTFLEPRPNTSQHEDIPVSWIRQKTRNSRCLLIADSCRVLMPIQEGVVVRERTFSFSDNDDENYLRQCRTLYERLLLAVPVGSFCAGYACRLNQSAGNIFGDRGGLYSDALLNVATKEIVSVKAHHEQEPAISFSYVHAQARQIVFRASNGEQEPELDHDRARQIPFCVIP
jgi:hypothetical protein